MANKFCTSCGASLDEGKKFCAACGQPVEEDALGKEPVRAGPASSPPPAFTVQPPPQQAAQQQSYVAPPQVAYTPPAGKYAPIGLGGWMRILLLMLIPIVNILLIIVWACGGCKRITQRSFARATLIMMSVAIVLIMTIGFVARKSIDAFIQESGIAQRFGIPAGIGVADLWDALTKEGVSDFGTEMVTPGGKEALGQMFPDGIFDEQAMIDQGYSDEEIAVVQAVMENDRQALLDMGYSEQETEAILKAFQ